MEKLIEELKLVELLKCLHCKHTWFPRHNKLPKVCPECKRYDWNVKKQKP